jgi:2-oxoglutarate dehydrogenase E2 component (dihydrolipoamide succinyltransferase)
MIELKVPASGESITEVQIGRWLKSEGDRVDRDEPLVELETDKAALELPSPAAGRIAKVLKKAGEMARVGEVIAHLEEGDGAGRGAGEEREKPPAPAPPEEPRVMPAARRALAEKGLEPKDVKPTGPGGRLLKEDVEREEPRPAPAEPEAPLPEGAAGREEEVVPMSLLRRRIAERLVEAQRNAALLTTFNEIDMSAVMALRREHGPAFQEKHGVKLGVMSFFVKAAIEALKLVPGVNAEIRENNVAYRNYYDIGVAVGGGRGLVVPVLRDADRKSFAEIERAIADFARRAAENKLAVEELQGGTFTISNGGIYGSLLSTPIVNPPQSGILGMHVIQDRPVVRGGEIVIRPMMYVALTYDHRLVDGREAVTFLKHIKEVVETPARILIEV